MADPAYNLDTPIDTQRNDWSCALEAARWAITAAGRHPSYAWAEQQMLADGIESRELGLLDGSGAQLAAWITRQYSDPSEGTPTLVAHNTAPVSFDDVKFMAGTCPLMIGGRNWGAAGHWVGVRGYDDQQDALMLANPGGSGPIYGLRTLNRQQFDERGPWSMVVVLRADKPAPPVPAPAPAPSPTVDPRNALIAQLRADLDEARSHLGVITTAYADDLENVVKALRKLKPA